MAKQKMENKTIPLEAWIGLLVGAIYGYIAFRYFLFDLFDVYGLFSPIPRTLLRYPYAIIIHGIVGYILGFIINKLRGS